MSMVQSFGRSVEPEPVEVPEAGAAPAGPLVVRVGAELVIEPASAQAFYEQVRDLTVLAVSDGLADVLGRRPDDGVEGEDLADAAQAEGGPGS